MGIQTKKNSTNFEVKLLGVTVFSIKSRGTEEYIGDQLISFNSETFQNDKRKYNRSLVES